MPKYTKEVQDTRSLRSYVDQLERAKQLIEDHIRAMQQDSIEEVEVRNARTMADGVNFVGKFAEALREAIFKYRIERGDFRAQQD